MNCKEATEKFLESRSRRGCSINALKSYSSHLRLLTTWLEDQNHNKLEEIRSEDLEHYLEHVKNTRHDKRTGEKSPVTTRQRATALKTFFRWTADAGLIQSDPSKGIHTPKRPRRLPQVLRCDDVRALINATDNPRDRAIIFLILDSGIRRKEVADLNVDDIDITHGTAHVRHGKGDAERFVVFARETSEALSNWLRVRNAQPEIHALFTTKYGQPMQPGGVYKVIRRTAKKAGIHARTHMLRHTFATMYMDRGGNIHDLKKLMGHENIETTMLYLSVSMERLSQRHKQLSFLDELLRSGYNENRPGE